MGRLEAKMHSLMAENRNAEEAVWKRSELMAQIENLQVLKAQLEQITGSMQEARGERNAGFVADQVASEKLQLAAEESKALAKDNLALKEELEDTKQELQLYKDAIGDEWDDPPISNKPPPITLDDARGSQIKRVAEEALFEGERSPKRLRSANSMDIKSYVSDRTAALYTKATHMVLREAGRGGLLNPLHFTASSQGLLCLTSHEQQRAALEARQ
jgi:hypothetical protein